jgi:hypothetical protein
LTPRRGAALTHARAPRACRHPGGPTLELAAGRPRALSFTRALALAVAGARRPAFGLALALALAPAAGCRLGATFVAHTDAAAGGLDSGTPTPSDAGPNGDQDMDMIPDDADCAPTDPRLGTWLLQDDFTSIAALTPVCGMWTATADGFADVTMLSPGCGNAALAAATATAASEATAITRFRIDSPLSTLNAIAVGVVVAGDLLGNGYYCEVHEDGVLTLNALTAGLVTFLDTSAAILVFDDQDLVSMRLTLRNGSLTCSATDPASTTATVTGPAAGALSGFAALSTVGTESDFDSLAVCGPP